MTISDAKLIACAQQARDSAHAPYSKYRVGAAVVADGKLFTGANVENASFAATICAERIAVANAILDGCFGLETVAVVTQGAMPSAPCGICLQSLQEFATDPSSVRILMANLAGARNTATLAELLPRGFCPGELSEE